MKKESWQELFYLHSSALVLVKMRQRLIERKELPLWKKEMQKKLWRILILP